MNVTTQLAKHIREVHFGGNWTCSDMKSVLSDVTWQQAITPVQSLNTIATLPYHVNYFVDAALKVLRGGALDAHDKFSFDHPPINSQEDWQKLLDKILRDAEDFAALVEQLPEEKLREDFTDKKYGSYFRNIQGIVEHMHYHLGQIALIKKMLLANGK